MNFRNDIMMVAFLIESALILCFTLVLHNHSKMTFTTSHVIQAIAKLLCPLMSNGRLNVENLCELVSSCAQVYKF